MLTRALALLPLALLLAGCWTPGPGQVDPTRYPWDQPGHAHAPIVARGGISPVQPKPAEATPRPTPPQGTYCVVALEPSTQTGITFSGNAPTTPACAQQQPQPQRR